MPIPAPGTYDVASQLTLLAVKAKVDASNYSSRLAPVHVRNVLAIGGFLDITIQPPAGETWDIIIQAGIDPGAGSTFEHVQLQYWDGAAVWGVASISQNEGVLEGSASYIVGTSARMRLTNAMYLRIRYVIATVAGNYHYSYFGWRE